MEAYHELNFFTTTLSVPYSDIPTFIKGLYQARSEMFWLIFKRRLNARIQRNRQRGRRMMKREWGNGRRWRMSFNGMHNNYHNHTPYYHDLHNFYKPSQWYLSFNHNFSLSSSFLLFFFLVEEIVQCKLQFIISKFHGFFRYFNSKKND